MNYFVTACLYRSGNIIDDAGSSSNSHSCIERLTDGRPLAWWEEEPLKTAVRHRATCVCFWHDAPYAKERAIAPNLLHSVVGVIVLMRFWLI